MFDPRKYCIYNKATDECEQQLKQLEDLPLKFVHEFKKAVNGGFVRQEAKEDIVEAYFMAHSENMYWEDVIKFRKASIKRLAKLEKLAQRQGELAAETYFATYNKRK